MPAQELSTSHSAIDASSPSVENHVANILRKLGLRSRTQIAVWAVERGLYRSGDDEE